MPDKLLVGFYDDCTFPSHPVYAPSLDIMKYSSYHYNRGDTIRYLKNASHATEYDIVYVRPTMRRSVKDLYPNVKMVEQIPGTKSYIRLPDHIEQLIPDTSYYALWRDDKNVASRSTYRTQVITRIVLNGGYQLSRVTINGAETNHPPIMDDVDMLLYDTNVCTNRKLFEIMSEHNTKIGFVYHQPFTDSTIVKDLMSLPKHHFVMGNHGALWNFLCTKMVTYDEFLSDFDFYTDRDHIILNPPSIEEIENVVDLVRHYINIILYVHSKGKSLSLGHAPLEVSCIDSWSFNTLWDFLVTIGNTQKPKFERCIDYFRGPYSPAVARRLYGECDLAFLLKILEPQLRLPLKVNGTDFKPVWEYGI